ncbi:metalloregulator ArsR/SmtB family transcription factor [Sulfurimonas sp. SAG-AH-194-L11]|nr:metalloregulator ArsR/SmtB family transcription factor [Sulfurimonas sp. SAG-AH-194-L11]MDF1876315.1 metalloregulator ArsR/SmtB family transcription factor [Sulfurimonas sp. SAG-AH-194-L11]
MQELVMLAKILSDINRVNIIALLKRDSELCVCEICDTLELSQPLVSRHLKQMREADIVTSEQSGRWKTYQLLANELLEYIFDTKEINSSRLPTLIKCSK